MMRHVVVSVLAAADIEHAIRWLRDRNPRAASLLRVEIDRAFEQLETGSIGSPLPRAAARLRDARRLLLNRFRYQLIFRVREEAIEVIALMHDRPAREPSEAGEARVTWWHPSSRVISSSIPGSSS
jgi:plasmid stabilization system protein ParE